MSCMSGGAIETPDETRSRLDYNDPLIPRLSADWVADKDSVLCQSCLVPFTAFRRRHHCRVCGDIFCSNCSRKRLNIGAGKVRACDDCHDSFFFRLVNHADKLGRNQVLEKPESVLDVPVGSLRAMFTLNARSMSAIAVLEPTSVCSCFCDIPKAAEAFHRVELHVDDVIIRIELPFTATRSVRFTVEIRETSSLFIGSGEAEVAMLSFNGSNIRVLEELDVTCISSNCEASRRINGSLAWIISPGACENMYEENNGSNIAPFFSFSDRGLCLYAPNNDEFGSITPESLWKRRMTIFKTIRAELAESISELETISENEDCLRRELCDAVSRIKTMKTGSSQSRSPISTSSHEDDSVDLRRVKKECSDITRDLADVIHQRNSTTALGEGLKSMLNLFDVSGNSSPDIDSDLYTPFATKCTKCNMSIVC